MKRFLIIILVLPFFAASCNVIADPFDTGGGGRGVYKSADGGDNFQSNNQLGLEDELDISVNDIEISKSGEIVYTASADGVYSSQNDESWEHLVSGIAVADISVEEEGVIYASGSASGNAKIIRTDDHGKSWQSIYTEPTKSSAALSVAVSPANRNLILAGLNSGEILRSSDRGSTWQSVLDLNSFVLRLIIADNSVYALSKGRGIWKSLDNGLNWTELSSALTEDTFISQSQDPTSVSIFHDMALDRKQNGVIYLGTQEGLVRTIDDGKTFSFMLLPVRDRSLKVSSVAINPSDSNNVMIGIGSTVFVSRNGGITWESKKQKTNQTVRVMRFNPELPNVVYLGLGDKK